MDAELEFAIQQNTTGKQLFDQVRFLFVILDTKMGWGGGLDLYLKGFC